jgi:hypothetical protein
LITLNDLHVVHTTQAHRISTISCYTHDSDMKMSSYRKALNVFIVTAIHRKVAFWTEIYMIDVGRSVRHHTIQIN